MPKAWNDINDVLKEQGANSGRVNQQSLLPTAVQPRSFSTTIIQNAGTSVPGSISVGNGVSFTLTSTDVSNVGARLMGNYMLGLFQDSISNSNILGNVTGWVVLGPFAMPENASGFTAGTDGKNLVFKTFVTNNTGSTHTVFFITDLRFLVGIGAGTS